MSKGADEVFNEWRSRKQTLNPPANPGVKSVGDAMMARRKSNLKDIAAHLNNTRGAGLGLRRLTLSIRAKSDISADFAQPRKKENTYKMVPDEDVKLSCPKIRDALDTLLKDELDDIGYDHDIASKLTCELSDKIKDKVKELNFTRHKIAVNVMVGQASNQGIEVASRCIWDDKNDNSVCVSYTNKDLFVIALVFGAYYE